MERHDEVEFTKFCETFNHLAKAGKRAKDIADELGMSVNTVLTKASTYRKKGVPLMHLKRGGNGGGRKFDLAAAVEAANRGLVVNVESVTDTETEAETANTEASGS